MGDGSIVLPAVRVNNILREWAGNEEVLVSFDGTVETGLKPVSTCIFKVWEGSL